MSDSRSPEHRRIEIGWTWIAPPWQRTPINTEAKLLMLRIGAVEEGVMRKHMIAESGRRRVSRRASRTDPAASSAHRSSTWQREALFQAPSSARRHHLVGDQPTDGASDK